MLLPSLVDCKRWRNFSTASGDKIPVMPERVDRFGASYHIAIIWRDSGGVARSGWFPLDLWAELEFVK